MRFHTHKKKIYIYILSSFTHPHVIPTLYDFISSAKQDFLFCLKNVVNQTVLVTICFHYIVKYFPQKKVIQVWSNMRVSEK